MKLLFLLLACTSAPPTTQDTSPDVDSGEPVVFPDAPTHDVDLQPHWDELCYGCHTGSFPELDFSTDRGTTWQQLVDVPSRQLPSMNRVTPGEPEQSYLWHKLSGTHEGVGGSGETMPKYPRALPPGGLEAVERWILNGAPR